MILKLNFLKLQELSTLLLRLLHLRKSLKVSMSLPLLKNIITFPKSLLYLLYLAIYHFWASFGY